MSSLQKSLMLLSNVCGNWLRGYKRE